MSKNTLNVLMIIGIILLINGVGNIIDDARVLTYDISSILTGIGFIIISRSKKY